MEKRFLDKLEELSRTKLLMPIVRKYGFKLEGGGW